MNYSTIIIAILGFWLGCPNWSQAQHADVDTAPDVAAVDFENSCDEEVAHEFNAAVALVHHMTYHVAQEKFNAIADQDPDCGMAYWGMAMSYIHPLWGDYPSDEDMARGRELIQKASATDLTAREEAYVDVLRRYYDGDKSHRERLLAFAAGFSGLHSEYPEDQEAKAFHALTHLATAEPGKPDYQIIEESAQLAFEVLEAEPDHPGAHHYIIHAYDTPELAEKAVEVARSYAPLAPEIPHALHMPTHIFTRLGMWDESIRLNERSADAAKRMPAGDAVSIHYPHALDYLLYAYLQTGQETNARAIVDEINAIRMPIQVSLVSAYALAAADARWALERHDWSAAAQIEPRPLPGYPWDSWPQFEALSHFAIAVGAARSGNDQKATEASEKLAELEMQSPEGYWRKQVEVMKLAAEAWTAEAKGNQEEAARLMKQSAELEESMLKHVVTPGEILPSSELLGDLMLEHGNPAAALKAYRMSLDRTPNRFNSLFGAGQAAEAMGDFDTAQKYYGQLVTVADDADTDRPELAYARSQAL